MTDNRTDTGQTVVRGGRRPSHKVTETRTDRTPPLGVSVCPVSVAGRMNRSSKMRRHETKQRCGDALSNVRRHETSGPKGSGSIGQGVEREASFATAQLDLDSSP